MSIPNVLSLDPYFLDLNSYNLSVRKASSTTLITMSLLTRYFHTNHLPMTSEILENTLPQVLKTKCFNDSGLPFEIEVKNTELGHLFEHILLEYLCQLKIKNGHKKATFRGVTNWDWRNDTKGTFHIEVDMEPEDALFFREALYNTIELFDSILNKQSA